MNRDRDRDRERGRGSRGRGAVRLLLVLTVATCVWLPSLHLFFGLDHAEQEKLAGELAASQVAIATASSAASSSSSSSSSSSGNQMRAVNPEWDFMRRTYAVLALANRAIAAPSERNRNLAAIDAMVDSTIATAKEAGDTHFMMAYAKNGSFADTNGETRSLFIDGEIVAMIAARDMVEPRAATHDEALERAARIERSMRRSPSMSGESYPNECWTFCNTTALAGLAMLDRAWSSSSASSSSSSSTPKVSDHSALMRDWVSHAKGHLVDPKTGLLVSSYTWDGRVLDGPEGSSIWMTASNLLFIDEAFARDQYARAKRELGVSFLGFGWAREWPSTWVGHADVDSGPIVPILGASAGSSGLAFLGAGAFEDKAWLGELFTSLELAGFREENTGHYRSSNDVGDAVLAYALSFGPLFQRVKDPSLMDSQRAAFFRAEAKRR